MHVHTQLRGGDTVCAEERSPPRRLGVDNGRISDFDAAPVVVAAPQLLREWAAPTGTAPPECGEQARRSQPEEAGEAWRGVASCGTSKTAPPP